MAPPLTSAMEHGKLSAQLLLRLLGDPAELALADADELAPPFDRAMRAAQALDATGAMVSPEALLSVLEPLDIPIVRWELAAAAWSLNGEPASALLTRLRRARDETLSQAPAKGAYVDWPAFWDKEDTGPEWLLTNILAKGRGHSIFAGHKTGKSLVMLWCAMELVKAGNVVIYLDYEMTDSDLRERLEDMGAGPGTDLSLLRYALLPYLPPLDTAAGGEALLALVDAEIENHPGKEVALIIDTITRAVEGEENPADTIRAFYSHTGIALKRRGVTWARLDHAGWDESHARGSSAKGDDVDVVWKLSAVDGGRELERKAARMGWVPEKVTLHMEEAPLRFELTEESWPNGTYATAELMDELGLPLDVATRKAQDALKEGGHGRRREVVVAAVKWRQVCSRSGSGTTGDHFDPISEPSSEPPTQNGLNIERNHLGITGNHSDRATGAEGSPISKIWAPSAAPGGTVAHELDHDPDGFPF